jgi:hypothetical protein
MKPSTMSKNTPASAFSADHIMWQPRPAISAAALPDVSLQISPEFISDSGQQTGVQGLPSVLSNKPCVDRV